ncbi:MULTISPECIES: hypothetical protein [Gordonibacter]|uniref:DUF3801 domain-containing protein n=1 Tax=Gordonibacter faecis TaxID=3047475 RepID=A0ABT7DKF9_9ACTN|nr:hypothetical protein [Gordonibacter sp. KGMB12511]MDJ1650019.1 hypothetical protein [Gordonibacter sp. KGMB12511]
MSSDYGDDAGEKMIDDFVRFGERMGEKAMYERAGRIRRAFENATRAAREAGAGGSPEGRGAPEWAKLDMSEFQGIEGYEGIKGAIEAKLGARGVESAWFSDPATGREHLLFRVADAREVWRSFEELAAEAGAAGDKAAEAIRRRAEERGGERGADRRAEEAPPKARPAHAKTFWQKHDVPVLRDWRPLEERAAHARRASAALEADRPAARAVSRGARPQEVRAR